MKPVVVKLAQVTGPMNRELVPLLIVPLHVRFPQVRELDPASTAPDAVIAPDRIENVPVLIPLDEIDPQVNELVPHEKVPVRNRRTNQRTTC